MTMQQLAKEAIDVQNACNPLGLSAAFGERTLALRDCLARAGEPCDTLAVCSHPVFRLWASKFHSLAGLGLSDTDRYGEAYRACKELAAS